MITTFRAKLAFSSLILSFSILSFSQEKLQDEKELEVVNFNSVRNVLKQDGLSQSSIEKRKQVAAIKKEQVKIDKDRYQYPSEDELWGFVSEYWLVKNAQLLGWDFDKPDYGIEDSFKKMLEDLGYFQKKFKILLVNTSTFTRGSLPGSNGEMIFILSVPFIRALDLSKLEISLLLLEDFFRLQNNYFKDYVRTPKMKTLSGSNFYGKKPDYSMIEELMKKYSEQLRTKGYNFQQQFDVTKKVDSLLKVNPKIWNAYYLMLVKMQNFLKTNTEYKDYIKLYPSPEMQIKWISPEAKVL